MVLAGRTLGPETYSEFIAFSAVTGVLVQGIGGALEQHVIVAFRNNIHHRSSIRSFITPAAILYITIALFVCMPGLKWQDQLFGTIKPTVIIAILGGVPLLLISSILRGYATAKGQIKTVSSAMLVLAITTLLAPLALKVIGLSWGRSFIFGQAIAWASPSLLLFLRRNNHRVDQPADLQTYSSAEKVSSSFVINNLLLLSVILSSQVFIRYFGVSIDEGTLAQVHVVVAVSCLSATLAVAVSPILLARTPQPVFQVSRKFLKLVVLNGTLLSLLLVGTATITSDLFILVILNESSLLSLSQVFLLSIPAVFLTAAVLLNTLFVGRRETNLSALAWLVSLLIFWLVPRVVLPLELNAIAIEVLISSATAPVLLLVALRLAHFGSK
jgi:O-antigen/teichoic acid export membrane protein